MRLLFRLSSHSGWLSPYTPEIFSEILSKYPEYELRLFRRERTFVKGTYRVLLEAVDQLDGVRLLFPLPSHCERQDVDHLVGETGDRSLVLQEYLAMPKTRIVIEDYQYH